ncbi:MAG: polyribonucleotide nucleotidyltransferase [Rickettsiales bacterium]|nr:polyribonucleotide nucleotidyltransferase [Rickettsiales bacterium]MDG4545488.1 polyribonucleotide nucleotidyltransferase [Rickettsiales bacterium]MDG4547937.1 polyribonucleotide nucleotidyltransferase [Rickettsiales bacterium]
MFDIKKKEISWGDRKLQLETGEIARQADGAVKITYGETVVLCTAVAQKKAKEGIDFFPLTVNYQQKAFAAGKIPGGFFKREGRPSEKETLTSRLIDRPLRPLFPDGFYNETQVIATVLSHDMENDPDVVALIGCSAALAISGIPFEEAIAGARVGYIDGKYVLNPTPEQTAESQLDLVVAGTESSVLMVESEAKILSEEIMLGAVEFGHKEMQPIIKLINEFKAEAGKPAWNFEKPDNSALEKRVSDLTEKKLREAYAETDKQSRVEKLNCIKDEAIATLEAELGEEFDAIKVGGAFKKVEKNIVRGDILKTKKRIDGRGESDVRGIQATVSLLPRAHGSALFTRGETQALAVSTLGTGQDMQIVDELEGEYKERFMLHYNFPPYSVGEASFLKSPGRREIGHGKLAWRAVRAVLPEPEQFPYTIRVVSEVTESNGSSSMATVCGSSLSMMDAGVPLSAPVAGIAMGLIKEGKDFSVLSDILGDEDHLGDMDFKVAGTSEGVTALQMDIKINGITTEIMKVALAQAKDGRIHILAEMNKAIAQNREGVNANAPQIRSITIPKDKIGEVIGPAGKNIREICETTGAKIDIEEDGTVKVAAIGLESVEKAIKLIQDTVSEVEIGKIYNGKVVKLLDFGALVNFLGKTDGLVHISEVKNERIEKISDELSEGDKVKVKVLSVERGKVRLSIKRVNQETGEDLSDQFEDDGTRPSSRGGRDGGRDSGRGGKGRDRDNRTSSRDNRDRNRDGDSSNVEQPKPSNDSPSEPKEDEPKKKRRFF